MRDRQFRFVRLLLAIPFIVMMWVPSYDRAAPEFAGIPFFYWYQLLWILIGALLILVVYRAESRAAAKAE